MQGLDEVLHGGLIAGRSYLFNGPPGAGKAVLALEFLDAAEPGETTLFVNLEEDLDDLRTDAEALGFDVDTVEFVDLSPGPETFERFAVRKQDSETWHLRPSDRECG